MAAITMKYLKIIVWSWMGKRRPSMSWIFIQVVGHLARQTTEIGMTNFFKMMVLSIVLVAVVKAMETL